jgi:hypothetical protein
MGAINTGSTPRYRHSQTTRLKCPRMYQITDEICSIVHLKIIWNRVFSPATKQEFNYGIHASTCILLGIRPVKSDIDQM